MSRSIAVKMGDCDFSLKQTNKTKNKQTKTKKTKKTKKKQGLENWYFTKLLSFLTQIAENYDQTWASVAIFSENVSFWKMRATRNTLWHLSEAINLKLSLGMSTRCQTTEKGWFTTQQGREGEGRRGEEEGRRMGREGEGRGVNLKTKDPSYDSLSYTLLCSKL